MLGQIMRNDWLMSEVNTVVSDGLSPALKSQDLKMQKVHGLMMKAMIATLEAMPDLKKIGQLKVLKNGLDGLVLLVTATRELDLRRREFTELGLSSPLLGKHSYYR